MFHSWKSASQLLRISLTSITEPNFWVKVFFLNTVLKIVYYLPQQSKNSARLCVKVFLGSKITHVQLKAILLDNRHPD